MAKYIAHSSIDENGKIAGGVAGDQTRKEVCIRTMYYKPWQYQIHINDVKVRKQFGNNMIDIAKNDNVGYDQYGRNTLLREAEKVDFDFSQIAVRCESDCSSAIITALLGAIYTILGKVAYEKAKAVLVVDGNCATTRTLRARMKKLTMITVTVHTASIYVASTSKSVFGDIYLTEGNHVICYIDDGNKVSLTETYTGNSIVEYLKTIGMKSDFVSRKKYATKYGITGYRGTAEQNLRLLELMSKDNGDTVESKYYPKYTGLSGRIDDVFKAIGVPAEYRGGWKKRNPIASANGINNYVGASSQNKKIIALAKEGKLLKP